MARIEALVIKTIIAGELPISAACRTYLSHPDACFELYGFDIMIDADLVPWVIEVNLSPSMACESPLDMKIKGHLMADFLSLGAIPAVDPIKARQDQRHGGSGNSSSGGAPAVTKPRTNPLSAPLPRPVRQRPSSAGRPGSGSRPRSGSTSGARPGSASGSDVLRSRPKSATSDPDGPTSQVNTKIFDDG